MASKADGNAPELHGYLQDILSQPDEFDAAFDATVEAVSSAFVRPGFPNVREVLLTGCGDSYCAGVSAAYAFGQLAGVRATAFSSMQVARYETALPLEDALVLAVSVSGETTRTVEAAARAKLAGATTVGISSNPESRLAQSTDLFVTSRVPPAAVHSPDARTYMSSLLILLLTAIALGEARAHLTTSAAAEARRTLRLSSDLMRSTLELCGPATERAAEVLVADGYGAILSVGSGPAYGTALFASAKIIEASGEYAWAQDGEEWAHIEYWLADRSIPTVLFALPGRAQDRMREQLDTLSRIGGRSIAVVSRDEARHLDGRLVVPIAVSTEEAFTPLLSALAVELLSYHLVRARGLVAYAVTRDDDSPGPSNGIRRALPVEIAQLGSKQARRSEGGAS